MSLLQIIILAVVQGAAELLPVSSSAHVIVAEKLMGLDPTTPEATLLLIMLHTGTMFAVIAYFWKSWRETYFSSFKAFWTQAQAIVLATAATGFVGLALQALIKRVFWHNAPEFEIEHLFGNARLMAAALAAAGVLIIVSSRVRAGTTDGLSPRSALWIGAVQGLCLPFRGFSRSGATISTGMMLGLTRRCAEEFSFVLAVVLTPVLIVKEVWRVYKAHTMAAVVKADGLAHLFAPSLLGTVFSFLAGLLALRWLSRWLEQGRWYFFGGYCLIFAGVVLWVG